MHPDIKEVLISEEELAEAVAKLGAQLTQDYEGKNPIIVGILKGSILFMADLIRHIDLPLEIDFMDVSSYGSSMESSGNVRINKDLDSSVAGRDIIIVEDIVDTGNTLAYIRDLLKHRDAASVRVVTLLNKTERRSVAIEANYIGIEIPDNFVVGYGLDFDEKYRGLPYIGILKPAVYEHLFK